MALLDLPAAIKKIRDITKLDKIKYIGYSEGNMTMNIALHYSDYVKSSISHYVALAPIICFK